ncbi:MAG: sodium-independent anion transporter, partial [Clostridia bacterium]|nr:sodium-independent anion transporter [Clostridia bacterium]
RMRGVQSIDITAMWTVEKIYKKYKDKGVEVIFSHVNDQPLAIMKKSGFYEKAGEGAFAANIDEALKMAEEICR